MFTFLQRQKGKIKVKKNIIIVLGDTLGLYAE